MIISSRAQPAWRLFVIIEVVFVVVVVVEIIIVGIVEFVILFVLVVVFFIIVFVFILVEVLFLLVVFFVEVLFIFVLVLILVGIFGLGRSAGGVEEFGDDLGGYRPRLEEPVAGKSQKRRDAPGNGPCRRSPRSVAAVCSDAWS